MDISVAEISSIIKQQITDYDRKVEVQETGTVLSCGDGIARLHGLENAVAGELLEFPSLACALGELDLPGARQLAEPQHLRQLPERAVLAVFPPEVRRGLVAAVDRVLPAEVASRVVNCKG